MKARVTAKRWEEDASDWTPIEKMLIKFARVAKSETDDSAPEKLFAVHGRGTILTGTSAIAAVAAGAAEEVAE